MRNEEMETKKRQQDAQCQIRHVCRTDVFIYASQS